MQLDRLPLLVITVIRYTRERKNNTFTNHNQIATNDYTIFRIFYKKTIVIICRILNGYLQNIDKNYIEN
jgi:hypothetical protein